MMMLTLDNYCARRPYQVIDDIKAILIRDPTHIDWSFGSCWHPSRSPLNQQ
jgi:hypothetical protein